MMADGESYYVKTYNDFVAMGLDGCAAQVLQEGLKAHPDSSHLRKLVQKDDAHAETSSATATVEVQRSLPVNVSYDDVSGEQFWPQVCAHGLETFLVSRGGLVRVKDVFPEEVAESAFRSLQQLNASEWDMSSHETVDYGDNEGAKHFYFSYQGSAVDAVKEKLGTLAPHLYAGFQASKYETSGHISPHDDSQYFQVPADQANKSRGYPAGMVMFRKIAVIYYLTKDWQQEYGGSLCDLHVQVSPRPLVPLFNSLVAFMVPRVHEVEKLAPGCPPRFTVFGWLSDNKPYLPLSQHGPELSTCDARTRQT